MYVCKFVYMAGTTTYEPHQNSQIQMFIRYEKAIRPSALIYIYLQTPH